MTDEPKKVVHLQGLGFVLGQQEKPRRPVRRPSVARLIRQARKAGATSIATPEGYVMQFEATDTSQRNEWDDDLGKAETSVRQRVSQSQAPRR